MKKIFSFFAAALLAAPIFAQKDPFSGFYCGAIENFDGYPFGSVKDICIEVARFGDAYQAKLTERPFSRADDYGFAKGLKAENGKIVFKDFGEKLGLSGELTPEGGTLTGRLYKGKNIVATFKRAQIQSPTLGLQAPPNATILFGGKDTSEWIHSDGNPCCWEIVDGAMVSRPQKINGKRADGTVFTKKKFGALRLHLEFKIPAEYAQNNARGNSGVHFGPFEVQIIDSFGGEGNWWQCGAIYRIHPPKVNASLEPEAWQTYDIEYTPAKFMGEKLVAYPELTVYHNGVRVQHKEPVFHPTNVKHMREPITAENIPIGLQDHGHPVAFRNVWVVGM